MPAQNGLIGDADYGVKIPETQKVDDKELVEEKKIAKYSKTKEFARIRKYFEGRIQLYQKSLPNGTPVAEAQPTPEDWRVANLVIKELNLLIDTYDRIAQAVEDSEK